MVNYIYADRIIINLCISNNHLLKEGIYMNKHRKRIALFVGQADESYQSRFISGFLKAAFSQGYDVCIFSMYRKYQDTQDREQGESNIFSLMNPERFDGAVILKDSIQTENAADNLELYLKDFFDNRIVVIEKRERSFPKYMYRLLFCCF